MPDPLPDDAPGDAMNDATYDANLSRLLCEAYRPPMPPESFRRRLDAQLSERQARGLSTRRPLPWVALAAAALAALTLAFFFWPEPRSYSGNSAGFFVEGRGSDVAERVGVATGYPLHAGDRVSTHDNRLWITDGAAFHLALGQRSTLKLGGRKGRQVLEAGELMIERGSEETIETPMVTVLTQGAPLRIQVDRHQPEDTRSTSKNNENANQESENPDMSPKAVGAAVITSAVIITVIVWNLGEDDANSAVLDTTANGGSVVELAPGERANMNADGTIAVTSKSDPAERPTTTTEAVAATPDDGTMQQIVGRVVDVHGDALAGAQVSFEPAAGNVGDGTATNSEGTLGETAINTVARSAVTDDEGRFELSVPRDVATGTLLARLARYETSAPIPWESLAEEEVEVDSEAEAKAEEIKTIILRHETAISGTVWLEKEGTPSASCLVGLFRFDPTNQQWFEPEFKRFETADGAWYYGPLAAGHYRLWAYQEGKFRTPPVVVTLGENEHRDDVHFRLEDGLELSGSVFAAGGTPIEGAIVYGPKEHLPGTVEAFTRSAVESRVRNVATTDADGNFSLDDLPPGNVLLRVLHRDYKPQDQTVKLERGRRAEPIQIELEQGYGIRGEVIRADGEPMIGAAVLCFSFGANNDPDLSESNLANVDDSGEYYLRNLNPGQYLVLLLHDAEDDSTETQVSFASAKPKEDTVVDFVMVPEIATLKGIITDEDGKPIAKIGVTASMIEDGDFSFRSGISDKEGRYEIPNLTLTTYTIALAENFGEAMGVVDKIRFEDAIDYERNYVFRRLAIVGRLVPPDGTDPPKIVELTLLRSDDKGDFDFGGVLNALADGTFQGSVSAGGTYMIMVTAPGYARTLSDIFQLDPEKQKKAEVVVPLQFGATVAVTVLDRHGDPLPGALVYLFDEGGKRWNHGLPPKTDKDGVYRYGSLVAGTHSLRVETKDSEPVTKTFTVTLDEPARVTVQLE